MAPHRALEANPRTSPIVPKYHPSAFASAIGGTHLLCFHTVVKRKQHKSSTNANMPTYSRAKLNTKTRQKQ